MIRTDWTIEEATTLHALPFPELIYRAQCIHLKHFDPTAIETASLLSIKTGGCPEDCGYCSQSAHHKCPSSDKMGLQSGLSFGGSGSFV